MAIFDEKIEIRERCKGVHCVDLGESFQTHIYLQNFASIQPRTSPPKFSRSQPQATVWQVAVPRHQRNFMQHLRTVSPCVRISLPVAKLQGSAI